MEDVKLRWAGESDYRQLGEVMFDAVRHGRSLYSEAQRAAWVPEPRSGPDWSKRLSDQSIVVAEKDGEMLGFMSLAQNGYVDFAYVLPKAQGQGLFRKLYEQIEKQAKSFGERRLWVHASLMAERAFASVGFSVVEKEQVELNGEAFDRFKMEKRLGGQA